MLCHSCHLSRFRHFCELAERLKAVGQEVDLLATVVWCGQVMWAVLALNCLVLGDPFSMGPFLIFYVFVMVSRSRQVRQPDELCISSRPSINASVPSGLAKCRYCSCPWAEPKAFYCPPPLVPQVVYVLYML